MINFAVIILNVREKYPSVYLSIFPMPCPLMGTSHPTGVATAGVPPIFPVSVLPLSTFDTSPTNSLQYSFMLLIHFTAGLHMTSCSIFPSLTFFTRSFPIPSHSIPKPSQSTALHPFSHSTIDSLCCYTPINALMYSKS